MSTKNSMMLDILYDSEMYHEDSGYSKAEKAKYNREYYQKHKQYWKDYYKTGQGIGRAPIAKPTSSSQTTRGASDVAKRKVSEAYKKQVNKNVEAIKRSIKDPGGMNEWSKKTEGFDKKWKEAGKQLETAGNWDQSKTGKKVNEAVKKHVKKSVENNIKDLKKEIKDPAGLMTWSKKTEGFDKKWKEAGKQLEVAGDWDNSKAGKKAKEAVKKHVTKSIDSNIKDLKKEIKDPAGLMTYSEKTEDFNKKWKEAGKQLEEASHWDKKPREAVDNYLKKHVEKNVRKLDQKLLEAGNSWQDVNEEIMRRQVNTLEAIKKDSRKKNASKHW